MDHSWKAYRRPYRLYKEECSPCKSLEALEVIYKGSAVVALEAQDPNIL
jgi:hypothetical protein